MPASKRLYVDVADEIKRLLVTYDGDSDATQIIAHTMRKVAAAFKRDNRSFRYETFFTACGLSARGEITQ